jgi:hypothetical protein
VPDGPVRDHVLADDPGAAAECHPAAGFPNCRSVVCLAGKERGLVRGTPYSWPHQLTQESSDATGPDYGETSEASAAPPGVLLQGDGGEDEDLGLAGCGLDVATA